MKITFNKNEYSSYKDFYKDVLKKLNSKRFLDWEDETDLGYNGNLLGEFLWYCSQDNNEYIFINFYREKMQPQKNQEDKEWEIIFYYFEKLTNDYPNNTLVFIDNL
ncbi:MAG: hypothetical protein IJA69_06100 [Clostridia bacterium]|nr:hypothetical protein [Clostridia bacterium]